MNFNLYHANINVLDLQRSIEFYKDALGFVEVRRKEAGDGSFILVFLATENCPTQIELTWYRDRKEPWNLGDNESHLGFRTDDFDSAHKKHQEMGCICYENTDMGIYFISDPDGYWLEIVPVR